MSNATISVIIAKNPPQKIQPGQFGIVHVKDTVYSGNNRLEGLIVVCNDNNELVTIGSTINRSDFKHFVGKGWQKSTLEKVEIEILPSGTEISIRIN